MGEIKVCRGDCSGILRSVIDKRYSALIMDDYESGKGVHTGGGVLTLRKVEPFGRRLLREA